VTRTPAEDAGRLARELEGLARRLQASEAEGGAALFSREDVDRIVSGRLAREQKRTRQRVAELERERDELEREVERLRRLTPGVDRGL
jgi:ABC-type transporter Mla subunit MlaD